ncbi:PREDICTED: acidic leucine-rich nuclear phosphoprotein 32 family member A-like [Ipomoea nil]|uniref:acidic leucine-rich nuclear phosphoprotein 32 family member A-like n=1 Tax=Ipomoea nil TaxID=35883 RepID=UPI000901CE3B|nr:PREDICTED: acidic leucine-rich nuclear phosphoprotein 32 family member A-like [Ipomoea nil]
METPSSTRRLTRSQAMAAAAANTTTFASKKFEESEKKAALKSRNGNEQERSALFDITNDSPIVGVAMGSLETPSSAMSKKRAIMNAVSKQLKTPGSGEALLRGQVKTLLQKVEEEAELSKLSVEYRPFLHLKGIVNNSPTGLFAPTPANTPHLSLSGNNGLPSSVVTASPVEEKFLIPQMVDGICDWKKEGEEMECMVTRTLFLDFSEKLESENKEKTRPGADDDDDDSSVWSIQVNASSIRDEEDYEDEEEEEECDEYYDEEDEEEEEICDGELVDEICEGISKMSVKFSGKHTRFVYNSDGELEGVVVEEKSAAASLCI